MTESFVYSLLQQLLNGGFDVSAVFKVQDYNALVPKYPLPTYDRATTIALVVGSTKKFWPFFVEHLQKTKEITKNPVDSFCSQKIGELCSAQLGNVKYEIRYDWHTPPTGKYVHIQTAGHVAGVAFYDQGTMWSVHPVYGTWFVYRAVVIIDSNFVGVAPKLPNPVLIENEKELIKAFTTKANEQGWKNVQTLLDLRRVCATGLTDWQYEGQLLDYFYPIHKSKQEVLEGILKTHQ